MRPCGVLLAACRLLPSMLRLRQAQVEQSPSIQMDLPGRSAVSDPLGLPCVLLSVNLSLLFKARAVLAAAYIVFSFSTRAACQDRLGPRRFVVLFMGTPHVVCAVQASIGATHVH